MSSESTYVECRIIERGGEGPIIESHDVPRFSRRVSLIVSRFVVRVYSLLLVQGVRAEKGRHRNDALKTTARGRRSGGGPHTTGHANIVPRAAGGVGVGPCGVHQVSARRPCMSHLSTPRKEGNRSTGTLTTRRTGCWCCWWQWRGPLVRGFAASRRGASTDGTRPRTRTGRAPLTTRRC